MLNVDLAACGGCGWGRRRRELDLTGRRSNHWIGDGRSGRSGELSSGWSRGIGGAVKGFQLGEETIAPAVLASSPPFFGSLIVFLHVLELLLAFLGAPVVAQLG